MCFCKQFSVAAFTAQYGSAPSTNGTQLFAVETLIGAGYRRLPVASGKPSATEAYCFCDQQGRNNGGNVWIADLCG
jgi:hypothetical protein